MEELAVMNKERAGYWVWHVCHHFEDDDAGYCMDCGYHYSEHAEKA
jgi:hypothetical protein